MPRPKSQIPGYSLHRPSGQACVYIDRQRIYLGRYGSPESKSKYSAIIADRAAGVSSKAAVEPQASPNLLTVNELCLKFATEVLPKYRTSDGKPSAEQDCFKGVIKILRRLFGETPAAEFGPVKLRLVRSEMVGSGWARKHINKQVSRLRYIFKFAVSWDLVPSAMMEGLRAVPALEPGETVARETSPKVSVPAEALRAVREKLNARHQDVFDLLLLTGARPGELLGLTIGELNRNASPWKAELKAHKNSHRGKSRTLYFNATAQAILQKYLAAAPDVPLLGMARKTFSEVLSRACERAKVERFTAHTLRHCVATRVVDEMGLEAAQRLLGHSTVAMTAHYSKLSEAQAVAAAHALG